MKRTILYTLLAAVVFPVVSCSEKLDPYSAEQNRLNFVLEPNTTKLEPITYTFVYDLDGTLTQDTIWLDVATMGFLSDQDRTIKLTQAQSDGDEAVAGEHYVPFDDPEMLRKYYRVGAGMNHARIPIVVKRPASLKGNVVTLQVEFGKNEYFDKGYLDRSARLMYIADKPVKPNSWTSVVGYYFAGYYGEVKHQFMIDVLRPLGMTADENFFKMIVSDPSNVDMAFTAYWYAFFSTALREENAHRAAEGLPPLREAPKKGEIEGRLVEFNLNAQLPDWED